MPVVRRLWERETALEMLRPSIAGVRAGVGSTSFVVGEAGLGETSLMSCARKWAEGLEVGVGEGVAAESAPPFGFLGRALGELGGFDEVGALAERAATSPLVLVLDDLHWADPDSLSLFGFVSRRLPAGVAVVATLRPWPPDAVGLADDLVAEGKAGVIRLAALSDVAALEVLVDAAGRCRGLEDGQVEFVHPLFAQEHRVADLAAHGATTAQIAATLFISAKTVEHHLDAVYAKLAIHSRRELRNALIANPPP